MKLTKILCNFSLRLIKPNSKMNVIKIPKTKMSPELKPVVYIFLKAENYTK